MTVKENGSITIIELSGEIDAQGSPEIKSNIISLIDNGKNRLVVCLAKVGYIDSTRLGVLVSGLMAARRENGDLKLASLQSGVKNTFKTTELNRVFEIFEDQADAVRAFQRVIG